MLPGDLKSALTEALGEIRSVTAVGGGDINEAARVETEGSRYFVKWNYQPKPRMFEVEAHGLKLLAQANAVRVPQVAALIERPPALVLEWIDLGSNKSAAAEALGRGLARQHRALGETFGLDHDNYIGANPQINTPGASWIEFFRDRRLGEQAKIARARGHLTPDRARRLDRFAVAAARRPVGRKLSRRRNRESRVDRSGGLLRRS
jgi:protein-ribulosamine 3-kinase